MIYLWCESSRPKIRPPRTTMENCKTDLDYKVKQKTILVPACKLFITKWIMLVSHESSGNSHQLAILEIGKLMKVSTQKYTYCTCYCALSSLKRQCTQLKLDFFPFLSPKQSLYRLRTC